MRKFNKHINNTGRLIVDSLMVVLLLGILALPASSVSLLHVAPTVQVLSSSDVRDENEEIPETTVSTDGMDGMDLGQSGQ